MTLPARKSRRVISGSGWSNPLTHEFLLESASYLSVWADDVELTPGVDYSVSGVGDPAGYEVTITEPGDWSPAVWVLTVEYPIDQPSDVDQGGQFGKRFEEALDRLALGLQTLDDRTARSLKVSNTTDPEISVEVDAAEPNSVLGWNGDGTRVENKGSVPQIQDVAGIAAEIVNVSNHTGSIVAVEADLTNFDTVAGSITNVNAVGGSIANVNAVAGDLPNIDTVAGSIGDVEAVGPSIASVVTVAADIANVNAVAGDLPNIDTVAGSIGDVSTVAGIDAAVTTVAASDTAIGTVASNIGAVNTAAANMAAIQAAPGAAVAAETARDYAYAWSSAAEDAPVDDGIRSGFSAYHWAAKAAAVVTGNIAAAIHAADAKPSPADNDELALVDSADGWSLKKLTWANIKAALSSVFLPKSGGAMTGGLSFGSSVASSATDVSRHIALYSSAHGFSVTASTTNYMSSGKHDFYKGTTLLGSLDAYGNWTVSGKATVGAGPTADMDVATKQYVDTGLAPTVKNNADGSLAAGYTTTAVNDGTKSSGTYTPSPAGGNIRRIVNGGAFTLAAPSASGDYTMIIQITNNSSAGAITLSGFTKSGGDSFTTTNGHDFMVFITKINGFVHAQVVALQ